MSWDLIQKILRRGHATDLWIRFDHVAVQRLNGRYGSQDIGGVKSFDILCDVYGSYNKELLHTQLIGNNADERQQNAVNLYTSRLATEFKKARGKSFVFSYQIRSISGADKYYLIFATGHPRGAIVASELICSTEETYKKEVEEFKIQQTRQLSLFSSLEPSVEEIFQSKVSLLAETMWARCKGKTLSRDQVYEQVLPKWFGKVRNKHINHALKKLQQDGRIEHSTGVRSNKNTLFTFRQ